MSNLDRAREILSEGGYTCVICSDRDTQTSRQRGVAPLLKWLDEGINLSEYSAADKVVGKGAAYLYILLEIKELYADVISRPAYDTLKKYSIPVTYTTLTDNVRNRDNTEFCPIETVVMDIDNPKDALTAIRRKIEDMKK
ncbi:MAG: DUF1893 domain-containing protein [Ruminococcus sp.]|nr:DUF1893 domain-containing protein [Ruminococcus sp.]